MTASTRPFVICWIISAAVSPNCTVMLRGRPFANRTRSDALRINAATTIGASATGATTLSAEVDVIGRRTDRTLKGKDTCPVYRSR